jgi:hypothetical protein
MSKGALQGFTDGKAFKTLSRTAMARFGSRVEKGRKEKRQRSKEKQEAPVRDDVPL